MSYVADPVGVLKRAIDWLPDSGLTPGLAAATRKVLEDALSAHERHNLPEGDMTTRAERSAVVLACALLEESAT